LQTRFILIDFENVQPDALASLGEPGFQTIVFAGANQTKVPYELAAALQRLGERAQYIKISGNGKNALDFHIAFYIGRLAASEPSARFYIVSNDQGFDPLIEHLKAQKIAATRINDLSQIGAKRAGPKAGEDRTAVVIAQLRGLNGNKPRTVKTLSNAIGAMFQKQLTQQEVASIVQALQRTGRIAVKDNKVAYLLA
jgi:hypothetical protein